MRPIKTCDRDPDSGVGCAQAKAGLEAQLNEFCTPSEFTEAAEVRALPVHTTREMSDLLDPYHLGVSAFEFLYSVRRTTSAHFLLARRNQRCGTVRDSHWP